MITINGVRFTGQNISIADGKVKIDGADVTPDDKVITIEVTGNIASLHVDACRYVAVAGAVGSVQTMSGDVHCEDVSGSVSTMSGDVRCGAIAGAVSTMSGDVVESR